MKRNPKNLNYKNKLAALVLLACFVFTGSYAVLAQESSEDNTATNNTQPPTTEEQKEQLQQDLNRLQNELEQIQGEINKYSQEASSYERDIAILESRIHRTRLQIEQIQVVIRQTDFAIKANEEALEELRQREERQKELLANILLGLYKLDDTSSVEVILMTNSLSDFFNDVARIKNLQEGMKSTLDDVKEIKADIEEEQRQLEVKVEEQSRLLQVQDSQRAQLASQANEKEDLLEQSRSREYEYREVAERTKKTIQEVRNQIFRLEGAGVAVTFEEAYEHAKYAGQLTGVRPAFLLSVLKQESSWGKNVGLCTLHNRENGDGKGVNTGTIYPRTLKASRDVEPFFQITQELGRDPYNTRISCWPEIYYQGQPYGYGGAMGPAQFLPSTWMGYRDRVASLLGRPADPWLIRDAFLASAVKLSDAGAAKQTYNGEWCAAMIYYSGRCSGGPGDINRFYGDRIMERAGSYQRDIDILEGG